MLKRNKIMKQLITSLIKDLTEISKKDNDNTMLYCNTLLTKTNQLLLSIKLFLNLID